MSQDLDPGIISKVSDYYTEKLLQFGETPQGVDWNGDESQLLRFEQLCKVLNTPESNFSLNDLGCGYGALLNYLQTKYIDFNYTGVDISPEMIKAAQRRHANVHHALFVASVEPLSIADYGIASGIFNVRLKQTDGEWLNYMQSILDVLDRTSKLGFSFNCLTSYSDEEKKRDHLYYSDPCRLFDLCKRRYSREVALLHDYGLYEFTILVKKRSSL